MFKKTLVMPRESLFTTMTRIALHY